MLDESTADLDQESANELLRVSGRARSQPAVYFSPPSSLGAFENRVRRPAQFWAALMAERDEPMIADG